MSAFDHSQTCTLQASGVLVGIRRLGGDFAALRHGSAQDDRNSR
jgi:hypothetical protein